MVIAATILLVLGIAGIIAAGVILHAAKVVEQFYFAIAVGAVGAILALSGVGYALTAVLL